MEYLELARRFVDERYGADADDQTVDVLARWESVLTRLESDPMSLAGELDWVAKLKLLEQYRDRDSLDWDDAKLALIDLQYSDIRPEKGLYQRLVRAGRIERLLTDDQVDSAMHDPPPDTRAYFRGRCLEKYAEHVAAASWDSVIFDLPGRESLQRVPTIDPLRGTRAAVGDLIDRVRHRGGAVHRPHALTGAGEVRRVLRGLSVSDPFYRVATWPRSRSNRASPPRPRRPRRVAPETDVAERKEALDHDVDDILDEIDQVLESNAEDFVKSFIQKGGQ